MPKLAGKPKKKKGQAVMGAPNPEVVEEAMKQIGEIAVAAGLPPPVPETPSDTTPPEKVEVIHDEGPEPEVEAIEKGTAPQPEHTAVGQGFATVNMKTEQGEITVKSYDEVLNVERFLTEPARVGLELGITVNLGNFESARISVSATLPCYKEQIDKVYDYAKSWCADRITKEVADIREKQKQKQVSGKQGEPLF